MALSVDSIKTLVQTHTQSLIGESDYTSLRHYLLKREPITEVITLIKAQVSNHYATEKETLIKQFTQEACESQVASDAREASIDAEELVTDAELKVRTTKELVSLEKKQTELESYINQQQYLYDQKNTELMRLNLQKPQIHVHGHYQPQRHAHDQPFLQLIHDGLLFATENKIIADIRAQERMLATIRSRLNSYLNEKTQTERTIRERKKLLEVTLPEKENKRQHRSAQRSIRDLAKTTTANINQHLSHENLSALNLRISHVTATLDLQTTKWHKMVTSESYPVYLKELEQALAENERLKKITVDESRALKEILKLVNSLPEMETKKATTMSAIIEAQNKLDLLRTDLVKKTNQVPLAKKSILILQQRNQQLEEQNTLLTIKTQSVARTQNNALYSSYVGISGSVLSGVAVSLLNAGLLNSLIISPIFFAIPGALGLVALVSLTVALVTYCHKSYTDSTIESNKITLATNKSQIEGKQGELTEETQQSIPKLEDDIKQIQQKIEQMTLELCAQNTAIEQQLTRANEVLLISSNNSTSFFKVGPTETCLPTAPPSDVVYTGNEDDDPSPPQQPSASSC